MGFPLVGGAGFFSPLGAGNPFDFLEGPGGDWGFGGFVGPK